MDIQTDLRKGNMSLLYVGIAAVVVIGGIMWYANQKSTNAPTNDNTVMEESDEGVNEEKDEDETENEDAMEADARVINVKGSPFKYEPAEIKVKKGEKVKIVFTNEKGMHDLVIDEFDVKTKQINTGESETIEFTPDEEGTFEYYCSVGNHKAQGMVGNLIVE